MLSQDLEWFDMPENSVGSLTTRLAAETSAVQKATGFRIGIILMVGFSKLNKIEVFYLIF